ncbi:zf-HC2 domain-containing protein [candidate division KSB1 bacterium]|nr:zf-HC2 domain-containing protein [candidate division KSB1 bacterium]
MKKCQIYQQQFIEALYGELENHDLAALNQHLAECDSCRAEFEEMKSAMGVLSKYERTEPDAAYWPSYLQRLEQRMENKRWKFAEKFGHLIEWIDWLPGWTYQLAGAMAILLLGIYIGYLSFGPPEQREKQFAENQKNEVQINLTGQEAADYLERSKILLLGIVNIDQTKGKNPVDFVHQQKVSRELLNKTNDLKIKIQGTKYQRLQVLIAELEMLLLQIANLEKELDSPAIDVISSGVDKQAILMKINLEEMLLDADENKI